MRRVAVIDAREIGGKAERDVLSLPVARDAAFEALYSYVAVDEPAVHLMPMHFCPAEQVRAVGFEALHTLGVASKLEYVRSRWIDEVVDAGMPASLSSAHRLHAALLDLIEARYAEALGAEIHRFRRKLVELHARHAMSVAVDGAPQRGRLKTPDFEDYVEHARARHGPYGAPVDAVLLLAGASDEVLRLAKASWHNWALGVQLYDDAVDVEEDLGSSAPSWTVLRALRDMSRGTESAPTASPESDAFYEAALKRGAVFETLRRAEWFFRQSALTAGGRFPTWVALQEACQGQTRKLREDLQVLVPVMGGA